MPGILFGNLIGLKPIIRCRLSAGEPADYATGGVEVSALVDTGATDVCIREELVRSLALSPLGETTTSSVGGDYAVRTFSAFIVLPMQRLPDMQPFHHLIRNARALQTTYSPAYDIILGMNVLSLFDMSFSADGIFSIRGRDVPAKVGEPSA